MTPKKILVVDDNEASAKTTGWTMEMLGQEARVVFKGADAIPLALSFQPDIIILDISLPDINGFELCQKLRQEPSLKHTLFVAQTGWDQEEYRKRSTEAGFHYHLVKPVEMSTFQQLLHSPKAA
jgi:CheY-like chemotaxis protein